MSETPKLIKLNMRHFKFTKKFRRPNKDGWTQYYTRKNKPQKDRDEADKLFLKWFRHDVKHTEFKVMVTHRFSRIEHTFILTKFEKAERLDLMNKMRDMIVKQRKSSQTYQKETREFDGARYTRVGGVLEVPNSINALSTSLTTNDPTKIKKPRLTTKNYLGIELEFNNSTGSNVKSIAEKLKTEGMARYVHVGTDPSCGFEVRVLLEEEGFEIPLRKIMNIITSMGFKAEDNCGTHVHLDMRSRNVEQVYTNLVQTQGFLRKFITRDRKRNHFCKPNKHLLFSEQKEVQLHRGDRYYGINVDSFDKHRTIEIRMHHGTLDPDVIIPYIKVLTKVINYEGQLKKPVNTLKQARAQYKIEPELNTKLVERIGTIFGRVFTQGV